MAGNFGLDGGGNVVIQQPAAAGNGPATRLTGGGSQFSGFAQASQAPQNNFAAASNSSLKTLEAINTLTQGMLKPLIEAEQKKAYFDGMAQVAQGKTLMEVEKDQPWYTKLFGPSATVQGAQAMTMMGAMNTAETQFYQQLPELSSKSPDEVRAWLVNQASSLGNTGDPTMDAMVQAKLAEQIGPLMKTHMKQHVKYIQDQNNIAFGNNVVTAGDALQTKAGFGGGFFTPEEMEQETTAALESVKPMPGQTPDAWRKETYKAMTANLMKGNFSIWEAFKQSPEYQQMDNAHRNALETQVEPYAIQYARAKQPTYREQEFNIGALSAALALGQGPRSEKELDTWMDTKNAAFAVQSGSSTPLFDNTMRTKMQLQRLKGDEYMAKKQAALDKIRAEQAAAVEDSMSQQTATMNVYNGGDLPVNAAYIKSENIQTTLRKLGDEAQQAGMYDKHIARLAVMSQNGSKWMDDTLKADWTTTANNFFQQGVPVSKAMQGNMQAMITMLGAPSGYGGLANYVGAENAAKVAAFVRSGVDLSDKDSVDLTRQSINKGWNATIDEKQRKEVRSYLADQDTLMQRILPLFGAGELTAYKLNDASKANLAQTLEPAVARMVKGLGISIQEAIPLAFSQAFGNASKVDFVDGVFSQPNFANDHRSMFSMVQDQVGIRNQASEDYQDAVKQAITTAMASKLNLKAVPAKTTTGFIDPVDAMAGLTQRAGEFDPDRYKTVSATLIGNGVMQFHRIPTDAGPGVRPITVTVRADQVTAAYRDILKHRAKQ